MTHTMTHIALSAMVIVGFTGCATDKVPSSRTETMRPVVQSQAPVIERQVVQNKAHAFVIREVTGRQTRILLNNHTVRHTVRDRNEVGDPVVARLNGPPSSTYATSMARGTSQPAPARTRLLVRLLTLTSLTCGAGQPAPDSANTSPRLQTVEGIVQQRKGNEYVIKDHSGRDVCFQVDNMTKLDRDIRMGDRVVVETSTISFEDPLYSLYTLGSPNVLQGEVIRMSGDGYVIRGSDSRDMRLRVDNTTKLDRNITVGDQVVAILNAMPSDVPYVRTMHRHDSPHLVQGEVIRADDTGYLVRDITGRDVRLQTTSATIRNDRIRVGDNIIADTGSSSIVHVDSIAKH